MHISKQIFKYLLTKKGIAIGSRGFLSNKKYKDIIKNKDYDICINKESIPIVYFLLKHIGIVNKNTIYKIETNDEWIKFKDIDILVYSSNNSMNIINKAKSDVKSILNEKIIDKKMRTELFIELIKYYKNG